ncbi:MAG: T9SS type A sorting domain-containing protein [Bacteroidota bacterium]|nr:T9SS type A sorting domain-containing protein [Bacteroidota bacterium]MDP3143882.1 T9SS type A sorting domain-containing protein [Bacteroidota bacterium]
MKNILRIIGFVVFSFNVSAQLLNGGMETFTYTTNDTLPTGWMAESQFSTIPGKTNDAHSGSSAFVINGFYYYLPGMLVNGNLNPASFLFDWVKAGTPISTKPTSLKGFYKYTNVVSGDSALVKVLLKKHNTSTNKLDTIGFGIAKLRPEAAYTNFEVAITDYSVGVQPDSVVVFFMSYDYLKGTQPTCVDNYCRYLYIDDLILTNTVGIKENRRENEIDFFYSANEIHVINKNRKEVTIDIYSIEGKLVLQKEIIESENRIDCSELQKGVYFVRSKQLIGENYKFLKD